MLENEVKLYYHELFDQPNIIIEKNISLDKSWLSKIKKI